MAALAGKVDPLGLYISSEFQTSHGPLATYTWLPSCGLAEAKGCVFFMHGIFAHLRFEFLEPDENNRRLLYANSLVEGLNERGFIVFGHDHPSHGKSYGEPGYWTMDVLRDAAIEFFEATLSKSQLDGKKKFIAGMSMGGTITIETCRIKPDIFDGVILFSPAVKPPDDSFGLYGRFLRAISGILNSIAPKFRAISLPPSQVAEIRDAVEKDDLVYKGGLSVRVGVEFLRVYGEINDNAEEIKFPALIVLSGELDNIVSPSGIRAWVAKVQCDDKESRVLPAPMMHEVLREPGREECRRLLYEWIEKRLV